MLCGLKDYTTDNVHLLSRRKEGKAEDGAYCHRILEKRRKLLNLCRLHKVISATYVVSLYKC